MTPQSMLRNYLITLAVLCVAALVALSQVPSVPSAFDDGGMFIWSLLGVGIVILNGIGIVYLMLSKRILTPLATLSRIMQTQIHAGVDKEIELEDCEALGDLPQTIRDISARLLAAKREMNKAVAEATHNLDEQKGRLEAILRDLHQGVIICNFNHQVILYNRRALELLHVTGEMGLGRSMFSVMNRQPFLHAIERLTNRLGERRHEFHRSGLSVPFIGSTTDGRYTLEGNISLIVDAEEKPTGYVVTFEDNTEKVTVLAKRDRLLRAATEGMRQPIANVGVAADALTMHPDMVIEDKNRFIEVIAKESNTLSERLNKLADEYRDIITGSWPMGDVYSGNLLNCVVRRLRDEHKIHGVMTGIPQWLHCDSYTIVELLDHLTHQVHNHIQTDSVDLEAVTQGRRVYLDILWSGKEIPSSVVEAWMDHKLEDAFGGITAREVLEHHKSDLWSERLEEGRARLRIPLPGAETPPEQSTASLPPRPEFYDFGLTKVSSEQGKTKLRDLTFVVFDTETTGLRPSDGDQIVSIAGVRILNGRILTGESFSKLVHPGMMIPKESIRFHGITDEMVEDQPKIDVVLPQFHEYVRGAVLVAHNAAFDMKFLKLQRKNTGLNFDNPVLDTLLLSVFLHDHSPDHTLDAVADRFDIHVDGRHTALGDSLVTAGVFLRMIDLLEGRGVHTLEDAIAAINKVLEVRSQPEF